MTKYEISLVVFYVFSSAAGWNKYKHHVYLLFSYKKPDCPTLTFNFKDLKSYAHIYIFRGYEKASSSSK